MSYRWLIKGVTMPSDFTLFDTGSAEGKNCSRPLSTTALGTRHVGKVGQSSPVVFTRWHPEKDTQHATPVRSLFCFFLCVRVGFNSDLVQRGPPRSPKRKKRASRASSFLRKSEECVRFDGCWCFSALRISVRRLNILDAFHPFVPRLKEAFMKQMQCLHASFAPFCSPVLSSCSFSIASATARNQQTDVMQEMCAWLSWPTSRATLSCCWWSMLPCLGGT